MLPDIMNRESENKIIEILLAFCKLVLSAEVTYRNLPQTNTFIPIKNRYARLSLEVYQAKRSFLDSAQTLESKLNKYRSLDHKFMALGLETSALLTIGKGI